MQRMWLLPIAVGALALGPATFAVSQKSPVQIQVPPLQSRDQGVLTLHANSRAVLLDVVVTDSKGHAIHGLKPQDFQIFEDGQPQAVASLEEHHAPSPAEIANQPRLPDLGHNTFSNRKQPANGAAYTVFLLDALDSPITAQMYAREQLLSWVKEMPVGTQVAVFQLDTQLHLIQGFTSDPTVLKAAIKDRYKPVMTAIPHGGGYVTAAIQMDALTSAMQSLGAYLQSRPGRKNLVWFTAHIPRSTYDSGTAVGGSLFDPEGFVFDYTKATDSLILGEVSVYPIDTRGLESDPRLGAANGRIPRNGGMGSFSTRQFFQHTDLDQVAEATGGKAFYNTNGVKEVVAEVIETGSSYYTLSYYPTNKKWDGSYRRLKVDLDTDPPQSGRQLQYRRGYYAQTEATPPPSQMAPPVSRPDPAGRVQLTHTGLSPDQAAFGGAMHLGAIDPAQIVFTAHVDVDPAVQKLSKAQPLPKDNFLDPKYKDHPFRVYKVFYRVGGDQLKLTVLPDGRHHGQLEAVTLLLDNQGTIVNSIITSVEMNLAPDTYAQVLSSGVEMLSQIAVPEKGSYFLRIGVHDKTSGKAGALEVSTSDIKIDSTTP